ncbi:hypothetical protein U8V72_10855 [Priestia filamentosa]|uniref:hypothetical protein n=1 Tax=Priestia filamentosa TaxID=1402861 RepID=UPI003978C2A6
MYGIAILIAGLNISIYSGNAEKETVVVVRGEIDTTKALDEQLEQFTTVEMKKNDAEKLGGSVVKNLSELTDKRLAVNLTEGSPIPKSVLLEGKGFGQFASSTRVYQTVYNIAGGVAQLPKGVKAGDKIDISIMTTNADSKKEQRLDVLMRNVEIHSLTETDVYVKVSQDDFGKLTVAKTLGEFVLQLPGQKEVPSCEDLSIEDKGKKECYNEADKPASVTSEDILKDIQKGDAINQAEVNQQESTNLEKTEQKTETSTQVNKTEQQKVEQKVEDKQKTEPQDDTKISDFNQ